MWKICLTFAAMKQMTRISLEDSSAEIASLAGTGGVAAFHVMIHITNSRLPYDRQLTTLFAIYKKVKTTLPDGAVPVFKRYFLSDAANQVQVLNSYEAGPECAVSVVEQPPLNGTKIALWVWLQCGVTAHFDSDGLFVARRGEYSQFWVSLPGCEGTGSEEQTRALLSDYATLLEDRHCSLSGHCLRTWFFVPDIDSNYAGVVRARNEVFERYGLTRNTHYIASTGIGGRTADPKVKVLMDAYAVRGVTPRQIHYLYAPTHLNPTYEYGVSFERGVCVDYGEYRQVMISGTASINNRGEIMYSGDVCRQTLRMWENVEALLLEAGCTFDDLGQMIVYLRDRADYEVVKEMFDKRFPDIPRVILYAPVCRQGWLIEMECMAYKFHHI